MSSNNKFLLSLSLVSLALSSVGCNSNLTTGHPSQKPGTAPAVTAQQKAAATAKAAASAKTSTGSTAAAAAAKNLDPKMIGTYTCDTTSAQKCAKGATMSIDGDNGVINLSWTLPEGANNDVSCDFNRELTLESVGAPDKNSVYTANVTAQAVATTSDAPECATAVAAKNGNKALPLSITLQFTDSTDDMIHYTGGDEDFKFSRTSNNPTPVADAAAPAAPAAGADPAAPVLPINPLPPAAAPAQPAPAAPAQPAQQVAPANEAEAAAQAQAAVQQAAAPQAAPAALVPVEAPATEAEAAAQQR